jgi:hypothetical protein
MVISQAESEDTVVPIPVMPKSGVLVSATRRLYSVVFLTKKDAWPLLARHDGVLEAFSRQYRGLFRCQSWRPNVTKTLYIQFPRVTTPRASTASHTVIKEAVLSTYLACFEPIYVFIGTINGVFTGSISILIEAKIHRKKLLIT